MEYRLTDKFHQITPPFHQSITHQYQTKKVTQMGDLLFLFTNKNLSRKCSFFCSAAIRNFKSCFMDHVVHRFHCDNDYFFSDAARA